MTEKQLIEGCLNGNRSAQEEIYNLYSRRMMGLCLRYVGDRETARDLLQDGFIKVFTSLHTFAGTGPLEAWMRVIFVNIAIEHLRKRDILRDTTDLDSIQETTVDETAISKLSAEMIMELVQKLPSGFRTVFNLYAMEGHSHKEIGEMLHIQEGTSRSQYARAKHWLREQIEEYR
ncbi:MAG: RNA polymerase sigma factor [Tannerella sp.]|jgi:RNA polymerase sigma-70 factor (ECF subfamily)|nr:RNA polymerase sigma factor [Tannerella sp.]